MLESIPQTHWQLPANDPLALTRLLDLPEMIVTGLEYDAIKERLIVFCEHAWQVAVCPTCRQISAHPHDYKKRTVRDLAWSGKACYLEFAARRFYCDTCRCPFREDLEWLPRCSRLTARYRRFVFAQCQKTTLQAVSQQERLGYKTVERLYYALATEQVQTGTPALVRTLGIDEFALKKGHDQFALALCDIEAGRVIAVLPDRKKESLEAYLSTWTPEQRAAVAEAAMDLWEPYAQAVQTCLPQARIVADRFHVMKQLTEQVTTARRAIQRNLPEEAKQALKGCRWLLVRNAADLSEADRDKLEAMFAHSGELKRLHALKEQFRTIFETQCERDQAALHLEAWRAQVQVSGLRQLSTFLSTLDRRWEHILNYFHTRLTSGAVEGLNTKIKLIKRCAYGFGNFEHFALRVRVECNGAT
jgi:transposase